MSISRHGIQLDLWRLTLACWWKAEDWSRPQAMVLPSLKGTGTALLLGPFRVIVYLAEDWKP